MKSDGFNHIYSFISYNCQPSNNNKFCKAFIFQFRTFTPSNSKNEPLMFFSSNLSASDIAMKLRSMDTIQDAACILQEELRSTSFGLENKYCDAHNAKDAWVNGRIGDQSENFLSTLLNLKRIKINRESTQKDSEIYDDHDSDNDSRDDDRADYNNDRKQILAYAIFQTLVHVISNGHVKTPLHVMTGQSIYSRCQSKKIIKSLNQVGALVHWTLIWLFCLWLMYHS